MHGDGQFGLSSSPKIASFVALLILAFVVRVAAVVLWWDDLALDPDAYRGLAERLAAGEGFVAPDGRATAFRPPVYPLMLTAVLWAGKTGIAALHVMFGVATTGVIFRTGKQLGLGEWSLLAAGLIAIDPLLLRYTPQVMTEVLCAFWAALLLMLAVEPLTEGPRKLTKLLSLGGVFGLAVLSRPTFLVFGALQTVSSSVFLLFDAQDRRRRRFREGIAVAMAAGAVVLPWGVRNYLQFERPIITTTHGGYTLLLANNPVFWTEVVESPTAESWSGDSLNAWQRGLELQMSAAGVEPTDEIARDRWCQAQAWKFIHESPERFFRAAWFRLCRLFDLVPAGGEGNRLPRFAILVTSLFYLAVFLSALMGAIGVLVAAVRKGGSEGTVRPRQWLPVLLLIASYVSVHAVYWTDARMRAPITPAIALLSGLGVCAVSERFFQKHRDRS